MWKIPSVQIVPIFQLISSDFHKGTLKAKQSSLLLWRIDNISWEGKSIGKHWHWQSDVLRFLLTFRFKSKAVVLEGVNFYKELSLNKKPKQLGSSWLKNSEATSSWILNSACCVFLLLSSWALFISPCQFQGPRKSTALSLTNHAAIAQGIRSVTGVLLQANATIIPAGQRLSLEIAPARSGTTVSVGFRGVFS